MVQLSGKENSTEIVDLGCIRFKCITGVLYWTRRGSWIF